MTVCGTAVFLRGPITLYCTCTLLRVSVCDLDRSCDGATNAFHPNGFHLTNHSGETWLQISPLELGRFR